MPPQAGAPTRNPAKSLSPALTILQSRRPTPMPGLIELTAHTHPPAAGGRPRELVVLLHGYGADGRDLLGLAPYWARALPHAEFVAPDAPFPCEMSPAGFQWFSF